MRRIALTGTDTGVGKTFATAALARAFLLSGRRVAVVKPIQTGSETDEPTDADEINRMLGANVAEEWQRLALPLAPETIAHETGAALTPVAELVERLRTIEADVVIVEGAGGVMVGLDAAGGTIADLAQLWDAEVVVVTRDTLGTLNHTGLTVEHLRGRGLEPVLVVGADTGNQRNHRDMVRLSGAPLIGSVPRGNPESADIDADWLNR